MLEKIIIHNFQCHKDVTLDLGRSTVLLGDSNCGKSAVLRALYWVIYNNPLINRAGPQNFYVSYWAQKKTKSGFKFKDDEYTSVTVVVDGHTIERRRSNDFNGYYVDGTMYEALRGAVPDDVTRIFNIADASVQQQLDSPFLLSSTPGEASQYLNSLAGLECVDEILNIAKKKVADTTAKIDSADEEIASIQSEINTYGWVDESEKILEKVTTLDGKIAELTAKYNTLAKTIQDYKAIKDYPEIPDWLEGKDYESIIEKLSTDLDAVSHYIDVCKDVDRTTIAYNKISRLKKPKDLDYDESDIARLSDDIAIFREATYLENACNKISALGNPASTKYTEKELDTLAEDIDLYISSRRMVRLYTRIVKSIADLGTPRTCKWTDKDLSGLSDSIEKYKAAKVVISDCIDYLDDAYDSLDGMVCPTCGRPLDKDTCLV